MSTSPLLSESYSTQQLLDVFAPKDPDQLTQEQSYQPTYKQLEQHFREAEQQRQALIQQIGSLNTQVLDLQTQLLSQQDQALIIKSQQGEIALLQQQLDQLRFDMTGSDQATIVPEEQIPEEPTLGEVSAELEQPMTRAELEKIIEAKVEDAVSKRLFELTNAHAPNPEAGYILPPALNIIINPNEDESLVDTIKTALETNMLDDEDQSGEQMGKIRKIINIASSAIIDILEAQELNTKDYFSLPPAIHLPRYLTLPSIKQFFTELLNADGFFPKYLKNLHQQNLKKLKQQKQDEEKEALT